MNRELPQCWDQKTIIGCSKNSDKIDTIKKTASSKTLKNKWIYEKNVWKKMSDCLNKNVGNSRLRFCVHNYFEHEDRIGL